MKKLVFLFALLLSTGLSAVAQKFCYVDTDYILNTIPEYKSAKSEIDKISAEWQKEIEAKYAEIEKMQQAYKAESILLTEELKKKREADILAKEKEARELHKQRFGVDGDLFKKRMELIKPIQDKVYAAIKAMAEKANYAVVLDKNSDITMLYSNPKFDKSDDVLALLGYGKAKK